MISKENNKCLITGGAGFVGSHLTDKLIELGYFVTIVDDLSTGQLQNINKDAIFINNNRQTQKEKNAIIVEQIKNNHFKYIFHLAANASVPFTIKEPLASNDNNVNLTLEVLQAIAKYQNHLFHKLIFASSSAIYGNSNTIPTNENVIPNLISPYALQKYAGEQYCELYRHLYGIPSVSLRFFNIFGPRQNGNGPYANVISSWLHRLKNKQSIRLDGSGFQKRDFLYVKDAVSLIIKIAFDIDICGVYNVGTSKNYSILEVLSIFEKHFENIKIDMAPAREGDPMETCADITKLKKDLNIDENFFNIFEKSLDETILIEKGI
jgi:UDP-glucose 4-epimerase